MLVSDSFLAFEKEMRRTPLPSLPPASTVLSWGLALLDTEHHQITLIPVRIEVAQHRAGTIQHLTVYNEIIMAVMGAAKERKHSACFEIQLSEGGMKCDVSGIQEKPCTE